MKTVLVTGFEPFGRERINPSERIARALNGRTIAGARVIGAVLPCVLGESPRELEKLIRLHRPQQVICLGLAGGRSEITPERIAINVDDARIKDNAGAQPIDVPIIRDGPTAYWSTLPIKAIVAALRERHIPAAVSQTAGTFVCNHVFYSLMHLLQRRSNRSHSTGSRPARSASSGPPVRGGFIHVPYLRTPARRGKRTLPLAVMIDAIALAIEVTMTTARDIRSPGGKTH